MYLTFKRGRDCSIGPWGKINYFESELNTDIIEI